jgi:hypothetical protein
MVLLSESQGKVNFYLQIEVDSVIYLCFDVHQGIHSMSIVSKIASIDAKAAGSILRI